MDKQIKQKAKRIFAAMLALTITAGTLPYTPLSGVVGDVAVTADAADAVTYIGADDTTQTITDYTLVTDSNSKVTWEAGNYVVLSDVTISVSGKAAAKVSDGTVNLILCNNAHLTVTSTGSGKSAIEISEELNIFAQSTGSDKGKLTAQGDYGADCKFLNVYGGEVTLKGTSYGLHLEGNTMILMVLP